MRNFILAAAAVVALSFATSTAMADNYGRHRSYSHRGYVPHHVAPHHGYRHVPAYPPRYNSYYRAPNYGYGRVVVPRYGYGYGYPAYSGGGIGVSGRNFSFYYGF